MADGQNQTAQQGPVVGSGLTVSTIDNGMHTLTGDVLTAPGRTLAINPAHHDLFAYVSDNTLLVAAGRKFDPHVATFKLKLNEKNYVLARILEVEISTLKKVYAFAAESSQAKGGRAQQSDELDVKMRRDLVELINRAAAVGASDIHISANDSGATVEMRIDGMLTKIGQLQAGYARSMMAAAFAMASVSDPTYTQTSFQNASIVDVDGSLGLPKRVQSLRLQWNPTMLGGRYAVMRLHYTTNDAAAGLESLGFAPHHLRQLEDIRQRPTGIVTVSGPTGSGKSTTLQKCMMTTLRERPFANLLTVEDPPEYRIPGAKQMQVVNATNAEDRSAKFIQAIMAALRSDPDIIMIGEIRDLESARLAYDAANTGHAVWTSLHANNAVAIIGRLLDLGLESWKVTDHETMMGLVAQRLLPKLCQHCKLPIEQGISAGTVTRATYERSMSLIRQAKLHGGIQMHAQRPGGCKECHKQGITGRTVAAEIIQPDEQFMSFCREHKKADARAHWIRELNGITLMAHGVSKMIRGDISPFHVEAMISPLLWDDSMQKLPELLGTI